MMSNGGISDKKEGDSFRNNDSLVTCREVAKELLSLVIQNFHNQNDAGNVTHNHNDEFMSDSSHQQDKTDGSIDTSDDILWRVMTKVNDISSLLLQYDESDDSMNSNDNIIKVLQKFWRCTYASSCLGNLTTNDSTMNHTVEDKQDFLRLAWMPLTCHFWSPLIEDLPSCFFHQDETISKVLFQGTLSQLPQLEYLYNDLKAASDATTKTATNITAHAVTSNDWKQFMQHFQHIIYMTYEACSPNHRRKCRLYMGMHYYIASLNNPGSSTSTKRWTKRNNNNNISNPMMEENVNTSASGLDISLQLLHRILTGYSSTETIATTDDGKIDEKVKITKWHFHVLVDILLPLHRPNSYLLWRDQIPTLQQYHEELCRCVGVILSKYPQWTLTPVLSTLLQLDTWPTSSTQNNHQHTKSNNNSNTPKLVLLLHEMDSYLKLIHTNSIAPVLLSNEEEGSKNNTSMVKGTFITRLAQACASDNSRLAERALEFFQNDYMFSFFLSSESKEASHHYKIIIKALTKNFTCDEVPWNPTVQKRTGTVLQLLQKHNPALFAQICNSNINSNGISTSQRSRRPPCRTNHSISQENMQISHVMKQWKQPLTSSSANGNDRAKAPPLALTGVAPWAVSSQPPKNQRLHQRRSNDLSVLNNKKYRPLAPVFNSSSNKNNSVTSSCDNKIQHQASFSRQPPPILHNANSLSLTANSNRMDQTKNTPSHVQCFIQDDNVQDTTTQGLDRVLNYIDKLMPKNSTNGHSDQQNHWTVDQLAKSPLLLPNLKFHDLVFGKTLGEGAFSTVQYARHIVKNKTRSDWPEYAVKIISTETIQALAYETNQIREIAILSRMVHPNISRIISSFRFRKGAYLVLEYANAGDLFTILQRHYHNNNKSRSNSKKGIEEKDACIVLGQVVAALHSIHELGFVYGDLKPENIMLTTTGHVKLTDFGACRPYTVEAREYVQSSTKEGLLNQLRNGDWKASTPLMEKESNLNNSDDWDDSSIETENIKEGENEEDIRIEGTTAYLPPEVILGDVPSWRADTWALGCVLYQCLRGRPPLLENEDSMTREKIVSFVNVTESSSDDGDENMVSVVEKLEFSPNALSLIDVCMNRSMVERPSMMAIASHAFFQSLDVFQLYSSPFHELNLPLDADSKANTTMTDSKWSRRQLSSIWAPQPKSYDLHTDQPLFHDSNNQSSRQRKSNTDERIISRVPFITNSPIPAKEEADGYFLSSARSKSAFPKPNLSSIVEK